MRARVFGGRLAPSAALPLVAILVIFWFLFPLQKGPVSVDENYGLLRTTSASSRFAIATFLTGGNVATIDWEEFQSNPYFTATRILLYQTLHSSETKCDSPVDFVVLVTPSVPEPSRQQLRREGAIVVEAEDVPLRWWIKTGVTRWKDQFLKLRLFEMTQYERLAFIDADTLLRGKVDGVFQEMQVTTPAPTLHQHQSKRDEAPLPSQFMFAARSDNHLTGERDHPYPPLNTDVFSAGFWVAAPSPELFNYMMSVMQHRGRFDPHTMEQSLLNYVFRRGGPMPWRELDSKWSATWPNHRDLEANVVSLHEKFWKTGPKELRQLWSMKKEEMEAYFMSRG